MAMRIMSGLQRQQLGFQLQERALRPIWREGCQVRTNRAFDLPGLEAEFGEALKEAFEAAEEAGQSMPEEPSSEDMFFLRSSSQPSLGSGGHSPGPQSMSALSSSPPSSSRRCHAGNQGSRPGTPGRRSAFIIWPFCFCKMAWDLAMAILIIYSVIIIPSRVGFSLEVEGGWMILDIAIDCCFAVDIALTFITGYHDEREGYIDKPRLIAWRYLSGYFGVDVVSVLPIDYVVEALRPDQGTQGVRATRLLRLVRLTKLARVFRLKRLANMLVEREFVTAPLLRMAKLICQVAFLIHMLACLMYWVATPICPDGVAEPCSVGEHSSTFRDPNDLFANDNWVVAFHVDRLPLRSRYLAAVHLVTSTLMGVGYGDLHPITMEERMTAVAIQLTGSITFGFILSAVTALSEDGVPRITERRRRLTEVEEWCTSREIPAALRKRIWDHFLYIISHRSVFDDESALLLSLPTCLGSRMVELTHMEYLVHLKHLFNNETGSLLNQLAVDRKSVV